MHDHCYVPAWMGGEIWGRMDTCAYMAESLHCSSESITSLLIGYSPIQSVFGVKKYNKLKNKLVEKKKPEASSEASCWCPITIPTWPEGNAQPQLVNLEVGQQPLRGLEQNRNLPGKLRTERSVTKRRAKMEGEAGLGIHELVPRTEPWHT